MWIGVYGLSAATPGKRRSLTAFIRTLWGMPFAKAHPATLLSENKGVFGINLGPLWGVERQPLDWFGAVLRLWDEGVVRPRIAATFPLEEAPAAHHFIHDRKNLGKVVLTTAPA